MLRRFALLPMVSLAIGSLTIGPGCADDVVGAVVPAIEVEPAQVELGITPLGALAAHAITIRSIGSAPLTVRSVTLLGPAGAAPSEDLALSVTDALPKALGPTQSMVVTVDHLPRDAVLDGGLLRIESDDPARTTVDVPIVQTAAGAPKIAAVPDAEAAKVEARTPGGVRTLIEAVHLGQVDVGLRKRATLHLVNAGDGNTPLTIERAVIVETIAELDATVTPLAPLSLPPLSAQSVRPGTVVSAAVEISWAPTRTGETLMATLRVTTNDPMRPALDIPITGNTQMVDPPILRVEPAGGLDFGTVLVGMSAERRFTVHNDGASPLPLEPMTLTSSAVFSFVTPPVASSIAPGGSREYRVVYRPTAIAADSARVAIISASAAVTPVSYPLTGNGDITMACMPAMPDPREPMNDGCATAIDRGSVLLVANAESTMTLSDAQLEVAQDSDWSRFTLEVDVGCTALTGYDIHAQAQVAPGDQAEVCLRVGDCTTPTRQACAPAGADARVLLAFGGALCMQHSNRVPVFVQVRHTAGEPTCQPYTLTFRAR